MPQPVGFPQPPSSPQPPPLTPLAFGSSYRRQHFRRPHRPDSRDGFKLRSCCLAILIDTCSKAFSQVVQSAPPAYQKVLYPAMLELSDVPNRHELADQLRQVAGVGDGVSEPDPQMQ